MMATLALSAPPPKGPPRPTMRPSWRRGRQRASLAPHTRRGRTSMPELPARDRQPNRSERTGKRGRQASLSPPGPKPGGRTMDATDTPVPENCSRGRSQTVLYNWHRPHESLHGRSPIDRVCQLASQTPLRGEVGEAYDPKERSVFASEIMPWISPCKR